MVVPTPGRLDPRAEHAFTRWAAPLLRVLFRPVLTGVQNLPADRPYLLVTNHSAGVGLAEILCFVCVWLQHVGSRRPIAGFALPLGFVVWPVSALHRRAGTIPSTYEAADAALKHGVPILVFPGGDHESLKPIGELHRVDFARRVGFLRIAAKAGVPVVPMGIRNGALTAPILLRGRWLAWLLVVPRLVGIKRWGLSLLAVLGAAAIALWLPAGAAWKAAAVWLWLGSPLTFLPIVPARLSYRIGAPLEPQVLFGSEAPDEATLHRALAQVQAAVQALVDAPGLAPGGALHNSEVPPQTRIP